MSFNKVFALACGVAIAATGADAVTINSLSTDTQNLTCGEIHYNSLAYSTEIIDKHIGDIHGVGTCETPLLSNKYVVLGQEYGNQCGACVDVSIGNIVATFQVFDHILSFANETRDNILLSESWLQDNGFNVAVPQPVSWELKACQDTITSTSTVEFSDSQRTSMSFVGNPAPIADVSIIVEGSTERIDCTRRNFYSNYFIVPAAGHDNNFVAILEFENGESAFVPVSNSFVGMGPFEVTYYNQELVEVVFSGDCNVTSVPVTDIPDFEDFPVTEIIDDSAAVTTVASASLAVVAALFVALF